MRHRALDYPADVRVSDLGLAALDELLDRGDLDDWAPVVREIRSKPWGDVARRVEQLLRHRTDDGTRALWDGFVRDARGGPSARPIGQALRELRERAGLTQAEVADRLGATQPEISKLERRTDMRLTTIRAYVVACGARLRLQTDVGGTTYHLD